MDNLETRIIDLEKQVKRLSILADSIYSYTRVGICKSSFESNELRFKN